MSIVGWVKGIALMAGGNGVEGRMRHQVLMWDQKAQLMSRAQELWYFVVDGKWDMRGVKSIKCSTLATTSLEGTARTVFFLAATLSTKSTGSKLSFSK